MGRMKTLAIAVALAAAFLPTAFSQTAELPLEIVEIRHGEKAFCEIVVKGVNKDTPVEGYAMVVGINAAQSLKKIREGAIKEASVKGAELCKVISGTVSQGATGGKAIWELIGLQDKPEGTCVVKVPDDIAPAKAVRVKAQLVALVDGKWIEKSKPVEKMIRP
jgi:hypothetical protein